MIHDPHEWWEDADNAGDIVLSEQRAIAVYPNGKGCLVIRQQADWNADEDSIILVQPEHAERVARALLNWAQQVLGQKQPEEVEGAPEVNARLPSANALRQRRYRRRRNVGTVTRNGGSVTPVTPGIAPDVGELFEQEEEHQLAG
ncbi:MAG: hypothetical protein WA156_07470 [Methylocystis silviterrae]